MEAVKQKLYSVSEYFALEEQSEVRHELINGNLFEMSGASREHHKICRNITRFFENTFAGKGYEVFCETMKIRIQGEDIYFYPDLILTKEPQSEKNKFVQFSPSLLVEVLSESTRVKDLTDKFIQYRKIDTLEYYMLVEPEKVLVLLNFKNEEGEWEMASFTNKEETVILPKLNISFKVSEIYQ